MEKKPVYHAVNVHVPVKAHDKLMKAVTKAGPVSVKLDLTAEPQDKIYVTWGQRKKIEEEPISFLIIKKVKGEKAIPLSTPP